MYHINTTYEKGRFAGDFEGVIYYEHEKKCRARSWNPLRE